MNRFSLDLEEMMRYYARLNTGAILTEQQYMNVPFHNPVLDDYVSIEGCENRTAAREKFRRLVNEHPEWAIGNGRKA